MTRAIAAAAIVAAALGIAAPVASAQPLPACQYEDGNVDGQPCLWVDPDTGYGYYVDSANYR